MARVALTMTTPIARTPAPSNVALSATSAAHLALTLSMDGSRGPFLFVHVAVNPAEHLIAEPLPSPGGRSDHVGENVW